MTVEDIIAEPLRAHGIGTKRDRRRRVHELLELVGLSAAVASRLPGAFSGGQRQRIGIARALSLKPEFIVADEPVSALDVSIQAQIINLLKDLQEHLQLSLLLVAHDLAVVQHIANRVAVMYLGRLVEVGLVHDVLTSARHPYTQALISAVPIPDPEGEKRRKRVLLSGDAPSPFAIPGGCRFHTRCLYATDACREVDPPLLASDDGRLTACHLVHPVAPGG